MRDILLELHKSEIQGLLDLSTGAKAIRQAYIAQAQGCVQVSEVTYLGFEEVNGDCHVKSGHIDGSEGFVVKIATGFYNNPSQGLASSNGLNLLFCAKTGQTLALLKDEGWLTDIRTGLGGALTTLALARADFSRVLIVGAGLQAEHQARCLQHLSSNPGITFEIWARRPDQAEQTAQRLRSDGIEASAASDLQEACKQADVIITTTPTKTPLVQSSWVAPGTHITAIGADCPGKQELEADLVLRADLCLCDLAAQSLSHGEFQTAAAAGKLSAKTVIPIGAVLSDDHPGRTNDAQITIADLTGLAVQDAAVSLSVYRAAQTGKPNEGTIT
ncbi:ornithine cyclodeaminase family protein [Parasedimentitalea maritima]|uniref:Ornithine cyclodeaminase family protein n=1 Tax=Parasedimentitalea maritima TaxID=2578117 RepID=A0ABY2UU90_9RHOB|nr:ornithine cyclodeaminase family protein [Zongyanglinia marina]